MPHVSVNRRWLAALAEREAVLGPLTDALAKVEEAMDAFDVARHGPAGSAANPYGHDPEWQALSARFDAEERRTWEAMKAAAEADRQEEEALRAKARAAAVRAKEARRRARAEGCL